MEYLKQKAIDLILVYTDSTNEYEAQTYMDEMFDAGMELEDIVEYFERG